MSNFVFYLHDEQSQQQFEAKLLWFKSKYNLISYDDLSNALFRGHRLRNSCMLTIDDGWKSTYDIIFPVIRKLRVPITVFVSPRICTTESNFWYHDIKYFDETTLKKFLIDKGLFKERIIEYPSELILKELTISEITKIVSDFKSTYGPTVSERGFINSLELIEMAQSGLVEVGAHTITHPILSNETHECATNEIVSSINQLSKLLNKPVRTFAYPNGLYGLDFSDREINILKSNGIETAFSVNPGYVKRSTNPYVIPRIGSISRLKVPYIGIYLPSRMQQEKIRKQIRRLKI